jgi:hypothetical protein
MRGVAGVCRPAQGEPCLRLVLLSVGRRQEHAKFESGHKKLQNDIEMAFSPLKDLLDPSGK